MLLHWLIVNGYYFVNNISFVLSRMIFYFIYILNGYIVYEVIFGFYNIERFVEQRAFSLQKEH